MSARNYVNTAQPTSLTSGVDSDDTTIPVVSTTGYPSAPFTISIDRGGANEEAILVQGKTSNSFTDVVRGFNGTAAQSHLTGVAVEHVAIALDYQDANDHIYNTGRDDHTQYLNLARLATEDLTAILAPYVNPIGSFVAYAGTTSPDTDLWVLANGQAISRTVYSALFSLIGTSFGVGDGVSTFNVPNLKGRTIIGLDNMGGASANVVVNAQADVVGGIMGAEFHTLTLPEIPGHVHAMTHDHGGGTTSTAGSHTHGLQAGGQSFTSIANSEAPSSGGTGGGAFGGRILVTGGVSNFGVTDAAGSHAHTASVPTFSGNTTSAGGSGPHNNMQPSMALAILIRVA